MAYKTVPPSTASSTDNKGLNSDNLKSYEYKPVQQALDRNSKFYFNKENNNYGAIPAQNIIHVESGNELAASPVNPIFASEKSSDRTKLNKSNGNNGNASIKSSKAESDFTFSPANSYFTNLKDKGNDDMINNTNSMSPLYFQFEGDYYYDNMKYRPYDPISRFLNKYCNWNPFCGLSCFSYITIEVHIILLLYLVNKTGQEMAVSSIPILTQHMFNWSNGSSGYYMAILGGLVLPANVLLTVFVKDVEDRDMVLRLSVISFISVLIMLNTPLLQYSLLQYVIGSSILFASLNSLEGFMMSFLSKVVSPELARGTFNSGLLATEAGTLGRVFGDMAITLFGETSGAGNHSLVNMLYTPIAIGLLLSIVVVVKYFDRLNA